MASRRSRTDPDQSIEAGPVQRRAMMVRRLTVEVAAIRRPPRIPLSRCAYRAPTMVMSICPVTPALSFLMRVMPAAVATNVGV